MVEFDVDMAYLEDAGELDEVVLLDENGELSGITYVPETRIGDLEDENARLVQMVDDLFSMLPSIGERCNACPRKLECYDTQPEGQCLIEAEMTELGV